MAPQSHRFSSNSGIVGMLAERRVPVLECSHAARSHYAAIAAPIFASWAGAEPRTSSMCFAQQK